MNRIGLASGLVPAVASVDASFTRPNDITAYAIGDVVCNSTSAPVVMTFARAAIEKGGGGILVNVLLIDSANVTTHGQFLLFLFDTAPGIDADNAPFTPTDAEMQTLVGIVDLGTAIDGDAAADAAGNCGYQNLGLNLVYVCGAAAQDLYGVLVAKNAYVPVAEETFAVRLQVMAR